MSQLNFDANTVNPDVGFNPVPAGAYVAMVTESDIKPTSAGSGYYLQLTWQILEGEYQGRMIWQRINIQNQNKQAQDIAHRELSNVCHAVGVLQVQDSTELHDKPCTINVKVIPPKGEYDAKNEIRSCEALSNAGTAPVAAAAPAQQQMVPDQAPAQTQAAAGTTAAPAAAAKPPWAK